MSIVPDYKPKMLREKIAPKCSVLYFPVQKLWSSHKCIVEPITVEEGAVDCSVCPSEETTEDNHNSDHANSQSYEDVTDSNTVENRTLHIVWPHRWYESPDTIDSCGCYCYREHDKGPEEFCSVLLRLIDAQLPFQVSILGSHSNDIPGMSYLQRSFILSEGCNTYIECLLTTIPLLGSRLLHRDHLSQSGYVQVLNSADVVVSTAKHEFFGVAM